jgi:hypothetical protein
MQDFDENPEQIRAAMFGSFFGDRTADRFGLKQRGSARQRPVLPRTRIALNGKRFIVGGGIPVVFAPLEHEEDGTENPVADGDDGALVATANDERLDFVRAQRGHPVRQFPAIPLERTKLPLLDARTAIGFLNQRTGRNLCLMDIEADDAFVQRCQFHAASCRFTLKGGRWRVPRLNVPEGDKSPTACLACALYGSNPGCESVRQVTLGAG